MNETHTFAVLVTGSRNWPSPFLVHQRLSEVLLWAHGQGYQRLAVMHGANPAGADWFAHTWCEEPETLLPVTELQRPAVWRPGGLYDPAAGYARNDAMVAEVAEYGGCGCLAFIAPCIKRTCRQPRPHGSHGARHCLDSARREGIQAGVDYCSSL